MRYRVMFYRTAAGAEPAREFLRGVKRDSKKAAAKIGRQIQLMADGLLPMKPPYAKRLEQGIFEIRVEESGNAYRVLYFYFDGATMVLTNGLAKKTRKTPAGTVQLARAYRNDYCRRQGERKS